MCVNVCECVRECVWLCANMCVCLWMRVGNCECWCECAYEDVVSASMKVCENVTERV